MYSKSGDLIQIRNFEPLRFVDLIKYTSISLDPSEVFITAKMTSVNEAIKDGNGKVLASFWEIPALARLGVETVIKELEVAGIRDLIILGRASEPVCELPVALNRVGMILSDGLNPAAAAAESGVEMVNHAMSGVIDFKKLRNFWDL